MCVMSDILMRSLFMYWLVLLSGLCFVHWLRISKLFGSIYVCFVKQFFVVGFVSLILVVFTCMANV